MKMNTLHTQTSGSQRKWWSQSSTILGVPGDSPTWGHHNTAQLLTVHGTEETTAYFAPVWNRSDITRKLREWPTHAWTSLRPMPWEGIHPWDFLWSSAVLADKSLALSSAERLQPAIDGKRYRDSQPNIRQTLGDPVEESEEWVHGPGMWRTQENPQNQPLRSCRDSSRQSQRMCSYDIRQHQLINIHPVIPVLGYSLHILRITGLDLPFLKWRFILWK